MLIIKEGLTDPSQGVRDACTEFLKATMLLEEEKTFSLIHDLSHLFKIIDCRQLFVKEYYVQLPFIIMRFIFSLAGEEDIEVARYLQGILTKLKGKAGLLDNEDLSEPLQFEEILFLRIAFEYIKMFKADRSQEFVDLLDDIAIGFEEYNQIFNYLLSTPEESESGDSADRLIFSEWVKFSLQLPIEDEVTRRNLVTLMFGLVSHVDNSFRDY